MDEELIYLLRQLRKKSNKNEWLTIQDMIDLIEQAITAKEKEEEKEDIDWGDETF